MGVPVVGLTGGIASGKSTAARAFAERGVPVVDADQLAREVVAPGTAGLSELVAAFGEEILLPDGSLDRKALGTRVFRDPTLRQTLNAITHPRIAALSGERLSQIDPNAPYVIYEAPLIVENGLHRTMHALIVVALDLSRQLERVIERDALERAEAEGRIAAQAPLARKVEVADYVIDNNGDLASLYTKVGEIHQQLLRRLQGGLR